MEEPEKVSPASNPESPGYDALDTVDSERIVQQFEISGDAARLDDSVVSTTNSW